MLRLARDADFDGRLYRALVRRQPDLDLVRVQDAGLRTAPDPSVLAWAAAEERILLTHDQKTMTAHAYDRVRAGLAMPGVFVVRKGAVRIGELAEEILLTAFCSSPEEWRDRVVFLPQ